MYLKQKRSKTRTNDDRRNALLWEIKAGETDDVKRICQYYYCCDIHYFCKEQIKLLHMWQNNAPTYIRCIISVNLLIKSRLQTMYLVKYCCNVIDDLNLSNEKTTYPMMLRNERKCQATHQITKAYILIN